MRMSRVISILVILTTLVLASIVFAEAPKLINYQGLLSDAGGTPVADATYSVLFTIYDDPTAGSSVWTETQNVTTTSGLFAVLLGSTNPIEDTVFNATTRYMGIKVDTDPELTPRITLVTVPYAFRVSTVDGASGGNITSEVSIGTGHTNNGAGAFVAGENNSATGDYSVIAGGHLNVASGSNSTVGGGISNIANNTSSICAGGYTNTASGLGSSIAGGYINVASGAYSSIAGGMYNVASDSHAVVSGGRNNSAQNLQAVVSGGRWNDASGFASNVGGGVYDSSSGYCATIAGGYYNIASDTGALIGGGGYNIASGKYSVVSGGGGGNLVYSNSAIGNYSVIGGGRGNITNNDFSTIGGGSFNTTSTGASFGTIGGGSSNVVTHSAALVSGGSSNTASGIYSLVAGGKNNTSSFEYASVGGGRDNTASGSSAAVGGGAFNSVAGYFSAILGGYANTIDATANYSYLFGINSNLTADSTFMVDMPHVRFGNEATGYELPTTDGASGEVLATDGAGQLSWTTVSGGGGSGWADDGNVIRLESIMDSVGIGTTTPSEKLEISGNILVSGKATIGTGHTNTGIAAFVAGKNNIVSSDYSNVAGGFINNAGDTAATVAGGYHNLSSGAYSSVGGGQWNTASDHSTHVGGGGFNRASDTAATVGGGRSNFARGKYSVIAGGGGENIADSNSASGDWSAIGGGAGNISINNMTTVSGGGQNISEGIYATVGGGRYCFARGSFSVVSGGGGNSIIDSNLAQGNYSVIGGGNRNITSGIFATIPGGTSNTALGSYSFAAGRRAKANHTGSFVWADQNNSDFLSTNTGQFSVRASGGTRIYSNSILTSGVTLTTGASSWSAVCDSTLKRNIREVDYQNVLERVAELPISQWSYKSQDESIEHIGPMAQDFYNLFGLDQDDKHINTLDPDGIALAAIKALNDKNENLSKQNETMKQMIEELQERLTVLESNSK